MTRGLRWSISAILLGLVVPFAVPGTATAEPLANCSDQDWLGVWAAAPSDASRGTDDFDRYDMSMNPKSVVRDESLRAILTPTFGGSDHLHFNRAGYEAMGDAVPLDQLNDPACS